MGMQKPPVDDDMPREPVRGQQTARDRPAHRVGDQTAPRGARLQTTEPGGDWMLQRIQPGLPIVTGGIDDDPRRHEPRFDRRANSFAALRVCQAGRIANENHAVGIHASRAPAIEAVGMAVKTIAGVQRDAPFLVQPVAESGDMRAQPRLPFTPQADVEKVAFSKTPRVALEVLAKIELGYLRLDATDCRLVGRHFKFDFLGEDYRLIILDRFGGLPRHGTEMPAGADEHRRADLTIDDPALSFALQVLEGFAEVRSRARTGKQVMIELATADSIADRLVIGSTDWSMSDQARSEARNRLQRAGLRIFGEVNGQLIHNGRRDPSCAHLVPREGCLIEYQHVDPRPDQSPGTRRSRRAATNDQNFTSFHGDYEEEPRMTRIRADKDERGESPIRAYPRHPRSDFFELRPHRVSLPSPNFRSGPCAKYQAGRPGVHWSAS